MGKKPIWPKFRKLLRKLNIALQYLNRIDLALDLLLGVDVPTAELLVAYMTLIIIKEAFTNRRKK